MHLHKSQLELEHELLNFESSHSDFPPLSHTSPWIGTLLGEMIGGTTKRTTAAQETIPATTSHDMVRILLARINLLQLTYHQSKDETDRAHHDAIAQMIAVARHLHREELLPHAGHHHPDLNAIVTSSAVGSLQQADLQHGGPMTDKHLEAQWIVNLQRVELSSRRSKKTPRWRVALRMKTRTLR